MSNHVSFTKAGIILCTLLLLFWNTEFAGSNNFEAKLMKELNRLQCSVLKKKALSLKYARHSVLWGRGGNPIMPSNQGVVWKCATFPSSQERDSHSFSLKDMNAIHPWQPI